MKISDVVIRVGNMLEDMKLDDTGEDGLGLACETVLVRGIGPSMVVVGSGKKMSDISVVVARTELLTKMLEDSKLKLGVGMGKGVVLAAGVDVRTAVTGTLLLRLKLGISVDRNEVTSGKNNEDGSMDVLGVSADRTADVADELKINDGDGTMSLVVTKKNSLVVVGTSMRLVCKGVSVSIGVGSNVSNTSCVEEVKKKSMLVLKSSPGVVSTARVGVGTGGVRTVLWDDSVL